MPINTLEHAAIAPLAVGLLFHLIVMLGTQRSKVLQAMLAAVTG